MLRRLSTRRAGLSFERLHATNVMVVVQNAESSVEIRLGAHVAIVTHAMSSKANIDLPRLVA